MQHLNTDSGGINHAVALRHDQPPESLPRTSRDDAVHGHICVRFRNARSSILPAEAYKRGLLRNVMRTKPMTAVPVWAPMLMLIDAFV